METPPTITASCEHCEDGAPVACIVGAYGLCAECKARMDARGLLVPVTEAVSVQPVDWDDLKLKMNTFIKALTDVGKLTDGLPICECGHPDLAHNNGVCGVEHEGVWCYCDKFTEAPVGSLISPKD